MKNFAATAGEGKQTELSALSCSNNEDTKALQILSPWNGDGNRGKVQKLESGRKKNFNQQ